MKTIILKLLLKLSKSPTKIYSAISDLSPLVFQSVLTNTTPSDYDEIEKKILFSAFILNFSSQKDLRSDFIHEYISVFAKDIFKSHETEDVIYLFENSASGISFGTSGSITERRNAAEKELKNYLLDRLNSYRFFIEEYIKGIKKNLRSFYFLISEKPFQSGLWHINPFLGYIGTEIELIGIDNDGFKGFQTILKTLSQNFLNLVNVPKHTWMTEHPNSPRFHTEGLLGTLDIPKGTSYLTFQNISGVGYIRCKHCQHSQEVISFVHGPTSATIGRQCPQCGEFCAEYNESKEYHQFGPSKEDFVCPKCKYIIKHKDESIFKGNENPLFCPKCESPDLEYETSYLT